MNSTNRVFRRELKKRYLIDYFYANKVLQELRADYYDTPWYHFKDRSKIKSRIKTEEEIIDKLFNKINKYDSL